MAKSQVWRLSTKCVQSAFAAAIAYRKQQIAARTEGFEMRQLKYFIAITLTCLMGTACPVTVTPAGGNGASTGHDGTSGAGTGGTTNQPSQSPNSLSPPSVGPPAPAPTSDRDGDGTPDNMDGCPDDVRKTNPGVCGCGVAETPGCGAGPHFELLSTLPVTPARKVVINNGKLYVGRGVNGIDIFSIGIPATPVFVGHYSSLDDVVDFSFDGNLMFVAESFQSVAIVDVSNPANPNLVGRLPDRGGAYNDVKVRTYYLPITKIAYVANSPLGVLTYDVTNIQNPTFLNQYSTGAVGAGDIVIAGGFITYFFAKVLSSPPNYPVTQDIQCFAFSGTGLIARGVYATDGELVRIKQSLGALYAMKENGGLDVVRATDGLPVDASFPSSTIYTNCDGASLAGTLFSAAQDGIQLRNVSTYSNDLIASHNTDGFAHDVVWATYPTDASNIAYVADEINVKVLQYHP